MSDKKPTLIAFEYAIKYLLCDKGDYRIVEGFLSALLKTRGYQAVTIVDRFESKSNNNNNKKEYRFDPIGTRSLADLIVQDPDNRKYVVEIKRHQKVGFIPETLVSSSKLIVDNYGGGNYTDISKIFHISLLDFPLGDENSGAIYHGTMNIVDIKTDAKISVGDATDMLPEFFYISIPQFNSNKQVIENEIDEWLYVMRYDDVPENAKSSYMEEIAQKLNFNRMTYDEGILYINYQVKLHSELDALQTAEERGRAKGRKSVAMTIAKKKLLINGMEIISISNATCLTIQEIEGLVSTMDIPDSV